MVRCMTGDREFFVSNPALCIFSAFCDLYFIFQGISIKRLKTKKQIWKHVCEYVVVCSGLSSLLTIFQSYHDGFWLRQGAQCSTWNNIGPRYTCRAAE